MITRREFAIDATALALAPVTAHAAIKGHTPRTDHHAKHAAGEDGANISYPSLIEVPEWVADPLGRYYLYFSSHRRSRYIRLVYANEITGPWTVYAPWDADRGSDAIAVRQRS